jgi:hypothetical protein
MTAIALTITEAGLAALAAALLPGGDPVIIEEIGLTATNFVAAPTLTVLPSEFLRLPVSGRRVSDDIAHMTTEDDSAAAWTATGLGVYLDTGTLFGVYDHTDALHADVLLSKASPATALVALDLVFQSGEAAQIDFGPATFLCPPATETEKGVAKIATQALVTAEVDDETIVTPKKLGVRLAAFFQAVLNALADFGARTITGTGLATGGGALSIGDIEINVDGATNAERIAAVRDDIAMTPKSWDGWFERQGNVEIYRYPGGIIEMEGKYSGSISSEQQLPVVFPFPFPNEVFKVFVSTNIANPSNTPDFWVQCAEGTITVNGFSGQSQSLSGGSGAISGFTWRARGR